MDHDEDQYPLHFAAFRDDADDIIRLIDSGTDVNQKDLHGNTPLHIAAILGHIDIAKLLITRGAQPVIKNNAGWSCLHESISYGNRELINVLLQSFDKSVSQSMKGYLDELTNTLSALNDFYMEIKWEFYTWIPLVSYFLPSDTSRIYKREKSLRIDSTHGFGTKSRFPKDLSILFNPENGGEAIFLSDKEKVYDKLKVKISSKTNEEKLNREVNNLMSSDIVQAKMSTKQARLDLVLKDGHSTHEICGFPAKSYQLTGIELITQKRREHLSKQDIKRNKKFWKSISQSLFSSDDKSDSDGHDDIPFREDLPPPPVPTQKDWDRYIKSPSGSYQLGRTRIEKTNAKEFKGQIEMAEDFPLTRQQLISIIQPISSLKQYHSLSRFMEMKLPPGFPIQLTVPLFATVSAKITFQKFEWREDIPPEKFVLPDGYENLDSDDDDQMDHPDDLDMDMSISYP